MTMPASICMSFKACYCFFMRFCLRDICKGYCGILRFRRSMWKYKLLRIGQIPAFSTSSDEAVEKCCRFLDKRPKVFFCFSTMYRNRTGYIQFFCGFKEFVGFHSIFSYKEVGYVQTNPKTYFCARPKQGFNPRPQDGQLNLWHGVPVITCHGVCRNSKSIIFQQHMCCSIVSLKPFYINWSQLIRFFKHCTKSIVCDVDT